MKIPHLIKTGSFQTAWLLAVNFLKKQTWEYWNLIVQIDDPVRFDTTMNQKVSEFSNQYGIISPKEVCYTIFPYGLYSNDVSKETLYDDYLHRFYPRVQRRVKKRNAGNWGEYFSRMVNYDREGKNINQLDNIINAINNRKTVSKSAYTILIEKPGSETIRKMGAPCLNYIAVQLENQPLRRLGLLSVYRNHNFLERAYGNYWGLCNLLSFLASETNFNAGPLTCVSSHAYVPDKKIELSKFIDSMKI